MNENALPHHNNWKLGTRNEANALGVSELDSAGVVIWRERYLSRQRTDVARRIDTGQPPLPRLAFT
jgi:hypothetical protein